jgi:hypothetical protein
MMAKEPTCERTLESILLKRIFIWLMNESDLSLYHCECSGEFLTTYTIFKDLHKSVKIHALDYSQLLK